MSFVLCRIVLFTFLIASSHFTVLTLTLAHQLPISLATQTGHQALTKSDGSRSPQVNSAASISSITIIENIRTTTASGLTRLVLDLNGKVRPSSLPLQVDNVTIKIPNAILSPFAKTKLASGTPGNPFTITQRDKQSVEVQFSTHSFYSYKIFSLTSPHRLVIDLVLPQISLLPSTIPAIDEPISPLHVFPQSLPPRPKAFQTIVLDPGHGGKDSGALGHRGAAEKDIALRVALKLRALLSQHPGIRVLMTRERDEFIELEDRAKYANTHNADLFVSIHVNSHPQRVVKGIEVYYFGAAQDQRALAVAARENGITLNGSAGTLEHILADALTSNRIDRSQDLAWRARQAMVANLNIHYPLVDHGVKTAPFYVLRFTSMPSILAEIGFLSNPSEEQLLQSSSFVTHMAEALESGVNAFLTATPLPSE